MGVGGIIGSIGSLEYDIVANDLTKEGVESAVDGLSQVEEQADKTTISLKQIAAAFATLTAVSATAVYASDRVVTLERNTGRAAITFGETSRSMYEYTQRLSNATDSQEEIGATMNYLSRTGLKMNDDLTTIYHTLDLIGDATGYTSAQIAEQLIPVLRSLGKEVGDVTKYADALAYASNLTQFDIGTWSLAIRRYGEEFARYNVPLEDTIAIMAKMAEMGIPQRKIITLMGEAMKEMGSNVAIAAKAQEELVKVQKELNDAQKEGAKTTRDYLEDMQFAGGDVAKMRQLTMAYNRSIREDKEKETELLTKQKDIQTTIDKAKNAPQESFITAISKTDPRFTEKALTEAVEMYKSTTVKGAAARYAAPAETYTGSEKARYEMDQFVQNSIGKNIGADAAASMAHLRDISGVITTISSILAITQGFAGTTALMTTATAAGSLNPIIAGIGFGALALTGMEAGGVGPSAAYNLGQSFSKDMSGETERAYVMNYIKTHNGKYPPGYDPLTGKKIQPEVTEYSGMYAEGGQVPGPTGEPSLAIVHGGETIVPSPLRGFGDYGSAGSDLPERIAKAIADILGGVSTLAIDTINLSRDYPIDRMIADYERYMSGKRRQAGVRT